MYSNLLSLMKNKKITISQLANLLNVRSATASDKLKGVVKLGFSIDEALTIKKVFFPEYEVDFLFKVDNEQNKQESVEEQDKLMQEIEAM